MERSPEEGLPLGLRRQGVQFKEKISKRRERQGSVGRHPGLLRTAVLRVWSLETLRSLRYFGCSLHGHLLELKLSNNEDRLCQQTSLVIIFTTIYLQVIKGKFALTRPG